MDNNNEKLQKIAQRIIDNTDNSSKDSRFGAIITIIMIISIILTLIRIIQECNRPITRADKKKQCAYFKTEIQTRSFKKSWYTKRIIKKAIRQTLGSDNYRIYGNALMNGILKSGETITDDESFTLVEIANV